MQFQFHITTDVLTAEKLDGFVQLCQREGVKATLIQLAKGAHTE